MKLIQGLRNKVNGFKDKHSLLFRVLLISVSAVLFLAVSPFDKNALTLYKSESIAKYITYVLYGLTIVLTIFAVLINFRNKNKLLLLLGLFIVFALVGFGWIVGSLSNNTFETSRLLSIGCLFIYYSYVIYAFDNKDDIILSITISLLFLVILSGVLYLLKFPQTVYTERANVYRFKGLALNRNSFFELAFFPFIELMYFAFKVKKLWKSLLIGLSSGIPLFACIFTFSATSIIVFVVAVLLIILGKYSGILTNFYSVVAISVFAFLLFYFAKDLNVLGWFFKLMKKSETLTGRTELWEKAFEFIQSNLVFGHGFDLNLTLSESKSLTDPHNSLVYVLLTQGIFGLIIVLVLLFVATHKRKPGNLLYTFLCIFIAASCFRGIVESTFSYPHFTFWVAIILLIQIRLETESRFPFFLRKFRTNKENQSINNDVKKASNSTFMLYLLTFAKIVFPLISLPYLTRILSKDMYGSVSYVKAVMNYVQLFIDFGFIYSAVKDIVKHRHSKEETNQITTNTLIAKLMLALASFVVVIIMCLIIPILNNVFLFAVLSFLTPFLSIFLFDFYFRGKEKMQFITITFVVMKVISLVLMFLFVKSDKDIILIPIFDAVGSLVSALIAVIVLLKDRFSFVKTNIKNAFISIKNSSPYFVNIIASTALGLFITLIIGIVIPDQAEIAYWSVAVQLVGAVQALYTPISNGIYPYMIKNKNLRPVKKILLYCTPIVILGTLFCFFYSDLIIGLVSGTSYIEGSYVFKLLAPVLLLSFPVAIIGWPVFGPINKTKEITISTLCGAFVQVTSILFLLLFNRFTLVNVCITRTGSELTLLIARVIYLYKYRKEFNQNRKREYLGSIGVVVSDKVNNPEELLRYASIKKFFDLNDYKTIPIRQSNTQKQKDLRLCNVSFNLAKNKLLKAKYPNDEIRAIYDAREFISLPAELQKKDLRKKFVAYGLDFEYLNKQGYEKELERYDRVSVLSKKSKTYQTVCDALLLAKDNSVIDESILVDYKANIPEQYCLVYLENSSINRGVKKQLKKALKPNNIKVLVMKQSKPSKLGKVVKSPYDLLKIFYASSFVISDNAFGYALSELFNKDVLTYNDVLVDKNIGKLTISQECNVNQEWENIFKKEKNKHEKLIKQSQEWLLNTLNEGQ